MKTFVLTVSRTFPKTHKRAGAHTGFVEKILLSTSCPDCDITQDLTGVNISQCNSCLRHAMVTKKLHTIRANYALWEKRAKQINDGKAILSLRYWSGKPYNSKQVEFCQLKKIGLQKLDNPKNFVWAEIDGKKCNWEDVAKNDGLSFDDFCDWFSARKDNPMAVILFTEWRY